MLYRLYNQNTRKFVQALSYVILALVIVAAPFPAVTIITPITTPATTTPAATAYTATNEPVTPLFILFILVTAFYKSSGVNSSDDIEAFFS